MDGNKRWAKKKIKSTKDSYIAGLENLLTVSKFCIEKKIQYLSAYGLSSENANRPDVNIIFNIIKDKSKEYGLNFFKKNKIKVKFIGEIESLPIQTSAILKKIELMTKNFNLLNLNIVLNYSTNDELISIIKNILKDRDQDKLEVNYDSIRKHMYLGTIPNPDLLIRTGGYKRLSNFLLLYMNYTEFFFTKTLWPDLKENEIEKILYDFENTKRNYGL